MEYLPNKKDLGLSVHKTSATYRTSRQGWVKLWVKVSEISSDVLRVLQKLKKQKFYHYITNEGSFEKALSCPWVVKKALITLWTKCASIKKNGLGGNSELIQGHDIYGGITIQSQNHRICRSGRDPQGSSNPTPGLAQDSPKEPHHVPKYHLCTLPDTSEINNIC